MSRDAADALRYAQLAAGLGLGRAGFRTVFFDEPPAPTGPDSPELQPLKPPQPGADVDPRDARIAELEAIIARVAPALERAVQDRAMFEGTLARSADLLQRAHRHADSLAAQIRQLQVDLARARSVQARPGPTVAPIPDAMRRDLVKLCHPDHQPEARKDLANKVTAWLLTSK